MKLDLTTSETLAVPCYEIGLKLIDDVIAVDMRTITFHTWVIIIVML